MDGKKLARQGLEGTLPWRPRIDFLNDRDEVIFTWQPEEVTIFNWEDRITLSFGPKDISMQIIKASQ